MKLTIEMLAYYLGKEASFLLSEAPFKNWIYEKSFENDLEEVRIDYIFPQEGCDFVCDETDKLITIFLYSDESRFFKENIEDLPFKCSREEVLARLGSPSKSGAKISDPILGNYGAWDRFARDGYVIHVEYRFGFDFINKITLMRSDVVP
ncbi:hypothetical protein E8K88_16250 [Lampropedia aestuarii]|uniref:Uncharacterized protein n=1 Tax=Lampropedia aestuarii TaxID=2562762 RepID=A0A4S5BN78_9BURK|nr:hypothetical protein [Lampropedia aestuarii]THJ31016.1 hypothetical protein E8K88_16250 [Lampropedia aestuarii]